MSEKTEQPSSTKLAEARAQGQLARSRLLSSAAVSLGAALGLLVSGESSLVRLRAFAVRSFRLESTSAAAHLTEGLSTLAWATFPALTGALLASALVSVGMAGFQLNLGVLAPKLDRLDPFEGLKKLFTLRQWVDLGKSVLVAAIVGWVLWSAARDAAPEVFRSIRLEGAGALVRVLALLGPALLEGCAVLLLLGAADYLLARRRHIKDLMMSRDELKQEYKNSEGDPHTKGKRKALQRDSARGGPARGVQNATAIVVNPTHIAVAIRYDLSECEAPYLTAKAREHEALALRAEAAALGIPVIRDIPLARSLIHYDVGEEVPEELYRAAAAVLKVALEQRELDT